MFSISSRKKAVGLEISSYDLHCHFCSLQFSKSRQFHQHAYSVHRNIVSREWLQKNDCLQELTSPNKKRSSIENESSSGKLNKFKVKYSGIRLILTKINQIPKYYQEGSLNE